MDFYFSQRGRMIVDWLKCGIFDVLLLGVETLVNIWLAINLKDAGFLSQFQGILILTVLPNLLNTGIWFFSLRKNNGSDFIPVLLLTLLGWPCPLFVYIWSIYLNVFGHKRRKDARITANIFRIIQTLSFSIPVLIINIMTLIGSLKSENAHGNITLNLNSLSAHIYEVKIHGLAFLIGFLNVLRSASLFNERKTFPLLFVTAGFPFILFTTLTRILIAGLIVTFLRIEWICLTAISLLFFNLILYIGTQKRTLSMNTLDNDLDSSSYIIDDHEESSKKISSNRRNNALIASECLRYLPKYLLLSVCSIFIPSAYSNDRKSKHPQIKGGTFILLNYFVNGTIFALTLGVTIFHFTPDDINGLSLPQPSLNVKIPQGKLFVKAMGLDIGISLPDQNLDLGSMPPVTANVNTSENDGLISIIIPAVLLLLPLPFVVIRALMMELDCFVLRRKDFEKFAPELAQNSTTKEALHTNREIYLLNQKKKRRQEADVLSEIARKRLHDRSVLCRLYCSLVFGFLGLIIVTLTFIVSVALAVINLKH
ncbi:uncharacterized protein [Lepeophtheirus salmonis]|uniref:uncharacterized protein isoform X1 n=2 Tax=Lepeophtheirus salmonis TaxID=72036 RepID=UPI001AE16319|nr:uncharacterized protein LOC121119747 isoform X1 [Lepeophtheirus salmonis]